MEQPAPTSLVRGTKTSRTRRTRFVCISDTHNCTPKLPKGDVLIHAGDLTNQGTYSELSKAVQWLEKADFETKIVIAGNHDITLDNHFYPTHSSLFHNQNPQDQARCLSLLTSSQSITYLAHSHATIRLTSPSGPQTTFTVFGSPYSPRNNGAWAFGYDQELASEGSTPWPAPAVSSEAQRLWSAVPLGTDVLVTHTPPYRHCDESVSRRRAMGCEALRRAMWRVRPRLHVCGHVHEGRGVERVVWDVDGGAGNVPFAERGVEVWEDPGRDGGRISLVDLTGRRGRRLDNDGGGHDEGVESTDPAPAEKPASPVQSVSPASGTLGLGASPDMQRSPARTDMSALRGRMGRRETCVVNCAITATNWPHTGGRRFNKPFVVDLDLPVWAWEREAADGAFGLVGTGPRAIARLAMVPDVENGYHGPGEVISPWCVHNA